MLASSGPIANDLSIFISSWNVHGVGRDAFKGSVGTLLFPKLSSVYRVKLNPLVNLNKAFIPKFERI